MNLQAARVLVVAAALGMVSVAQASDWEARCAKTYKSEKPAWSACVQKKCDKYALGGAQQNRTKHTQCLDECAEAQSSRFFSCYQDLVNSLN